MTAALNILKRKEVIIALVVLVVLVAVYFYGKKAGSKCGWMDKLTGNCPKNNNSQNLAELLKEKSGTGAVSYSETTYSRLADQLYEALDGWGTDDTMVREVFLQMASSNDVKNLEVAFGIRDGESLGSWLKGDGVLTEVYNILNSRSIDYNFEIIE